MKILKPVLCAAAVCALPIVAALPARADITMTSHMNMDSPMMRQAAPSMTPAMRTMLDKYSNTTTYISGAKFRVDSAFMTMIIDQKEHKMWMLNPAAHTYTESTYDPTQMQAMVQSAGKLPSVSAKNMTYRVTDTGKTTRILGHTARHYIVHVSMTTLGKPMTMTEDILAAQDLPTSDLSFYQKAASALGTQVRGLPLVTSTRVIGGSGDGTTMKQTVTSISTQPISTATFTVPAGYSLTKAGNPFTNMFRHMPGR